MIKRVKWNFVHDDDRGNGSDSSVGSSLEDEEGKSVGDGASDSSGDDLNEAQMLASLLDNDDMIRPREVVAKDETPAEARVQRRARPEASGQVKSESQSNADVAKRVVEAKLEEAELEEEVERQAAELRDEESEGESEESDEAADAKPTVDTTAPMIEYLRTERLQATRIRLCRICTFKTLLNDKDVEDHLQSRQHKKSVRRMLGGGDKDASAIRKGAEPQPGIEGDGNDGGTSPRSPGSGKKRRKRPDAKKRGALKAKSKAADGASERPKENRKTRRALAQQAKLNAQALGQPGSTSAAERSKRKEAPLRDSGPAAAGDERGDGAENSKKRKLKRENRTKSSVGSGKGTNSSLEHSKGTGAKVAKRADAAKGRKIDRKSVPRSKGTVS